MCHEHRKRHTCPPVSSGKWDWGRKEEGTAGKFKVRIGCDAEKYVIALDALRKMGCMWVTWDDLHGWHFDPYEIYGLHVDEEKRVMISSSVEGYLRDMSEDWTYLILYGDKQRFESDQTAKDDTDKPDLTLVPMQILYSIAEVRKYGTKKYKDPDNWKKVSAERYRKALLRHCISYIRDPDGKDAESGLPHLWHLACNVAFLCEMEEHDA